MKKTGMFMIALLLVSIITSSFVLAETYSTTNTRQQEQFSFSPISTGPSLTETEIEAETGIKIPEIDSSSVTTNNLMIAIFGNGPKVDFVIREHRYVTGIKENGEKTVSTKTVYSGKIETTDKGSFVVNGESLEELKAKKTNPNPEILKEVSSKEKSEIATEQATVKILLSEKIVEITFENGDVRSYELTKIERRPIRTSVARGGSLAKSDESSATSEEKSFWERFLNKNKVVNTGQVKNEAVATQVQEEAHSSFFAKLRKFFSFNAKKEGDLSTN